MKMDLAKDEQEYIEKHGEIDDETPVPEILKNFWFFENYYSPQEKREVFRDIQAFIKQAREFGYALPEWEPEISSDPE
jgi:hypothetical protein